MNLKLSTREKILTSGAIIAIVFFLFWSFVFNPLLNKTKNLGVEIKVLKQQLESLQKDASIIEAVNERGQLTAGLLSKDDELKLLVEFMEKRVEQLGIKLDVLEQISGENEIGVNVAFTCGYSSLLAFLNYLSTISSQYVVNFADIKEASSRLFVQLEIMAPYQK